MRENKTKATKSSVATYLAGIDNEARRKDCEELADLMAKATREPPVMWGSSIVGFGTRQYALAAGRVGDICRVGFSSREGDISIYGVAGPSVDEEMIAKLGKHKRGKGCLYVAKLDDIDRKVLRALIVQAMRR